MGSDMGQFFSNSVLTRGSLYLVSIGYVRKNFLILGKGSGSARKSLSYKACVR